MTAAPVATADPRALAHQIGVAVAGPTSAGVDRDALFPKETIDALAEHRLLGALVPTELGGLGHDLRQAAAVVRELARHCASSAMVLAMHHVQVACLVRHGTTPELRAFTARVAAEQLLLGSATTEVGIGGDTRNSTCAVETDGERFTLVKQAPVISYGEQADAILTTARRDPDAASNDQVVAVCERERLTLTPTSTWDALGFRGTCSPGFVLHAEGPAAMVIGAPFATVSSHTMLPTAHLLWASVWLGIADEASWRAQRFVQRAARKSLGTVPPGATRLAALLVTRQQLASAVDTVLTRYLGIHDEPELTGDLDFMVEVNALKVSASTLVVDVVNQAMLICGIQGYRDEGEYALGRLLRDAHGAAIMVNNDRIAANTAQLALAQREA